MFTRFLNFFKTKPIANCNIYEKINRIYYINLEQRKDRKAHIEKEIKKIDPELKITTRIQAIKHEQSGIGCCLSHIETLNQAIKNKDQNILIFEDDFKFKVDTPSFLRSLSYLFKHYPHYNLCMISRKLLKSKKVCSQISEVHEGQTVSGVIVNQRFFKTLKASFLESYRNLLAGNPEIKDGYCGVGDEYAIDQYWKKLQGPKKGFYTFNKALGQQIDSYSDIEKRYAKYKC